MISRALLALLFAALPAWSQTLNLEARSQKVNPEDKKKQFRVVNTKLEWKARETAIVVCDMWDKHWCDGATRRVGEMAPRMNEVLKAARQQGVLIIHCPSSCMDAYKDSPMRKRAYTAQKIQTKIRQLEEMLVSKLQGKQLSPPAQAIDATEAAAKVFPPGPGESEVETPINQEKQRLTES